MLSLVVPTIGFKSCFIHHGIQCFAIITFGTYWRNFQGTKATFERVTSLSLELQSFIQFWIQTELSKFNFHILNGA